MLPSGFGRAEDGDAVDGLGHGLPHGWSPSQMAIDRPE
jgi:hypothetical protein